MMADKELGEEDNTGAVRWNADENFGLILPDTKRVKLKQEKARIEKENAEKEREEQKKQRDELAKKIKRERDKKKLEEKRAKEKKDEEQRTKDEAKAILDSRRDNLMELLSTISRNTSPYEISFANYRMDGTQEFNLLMTVLEDNTSVLTLSLSRKNLTDDEGKKLALMLSKNKKLRRLELEGNFLGPETARAIGKALEKNVTLRYLDLENNNLTLHGTDNSGLKDLCNSLKKNKMLISLNISNNFLDQDCGGILEDLLRTNDIIIHLEFFQNKDFQTLATSDKADEDSKFKPNGLFIQKIEAIKAYLKRNNEAYTKMRTDEWKERKGMTSDYEENINNKNLLEARQLEEDTRKKEHDYIELLYLDNFNQHVKDMENQFNDAVNQYFAETKERLAKKKKKKKKKKS